MHSIIQALIGGGLIGFSALLLLLINGRIMGISGILGGAINKQVSDKSWRFASLAGFLVGGAALYFYQPSLVVYELDRSWLSIACAGLLVGFGTQLGGGCTSGHGVCGISRLSLRSITATAVFMLMGMITVFLMGFL